MTWKSTAIHDGNELKRFGKKHSGGGFGGTFTKNLHEPVSIPSALIGRTDFTPGTATGVLPEARRLEGIHTESFLIRDE